MFFLHCKPHCAVAKFVRDSPQVMFCAYQDIWNQPDVSRITFDSFISSFMAQAFTQVPPLELATGRVIITVPGHYSISFSGYSHVDPGKVHEVHLDLGGTRVNGTFYEAWTNSGNWKTTGHGSWSIVSSRDRSVALLTPRSST